MKDLPLIEQLNSLDKNEEQSTLPSSIKYQQYELEVDKAAQIVNIPLREAQAFEDAITKIKEPLTRSTLKSLLREFRGIRG